AYIGKGLRPDADSEVIFASSDRECPADLRLSRSGRRRNQAQARRDAGGPRTSAGRSRIMVRVERGGTRAPAHRTECRRVDRHHKPPGITTALRQAPSGHYNLLGTAAPWASGRRRRLGRSHMSDIKKYAGQIVSTLRNAGYQACFVGGCVRDLLLGRDPADYDVATDATPDEVMRIFPETYAVAAQFGVMLVPVRDIASNLSTEESENTGRDVAGQVSPE